MPAVVYRITDLLAKTLEEVPVGTNLGLLHLLFALLSGHFLNARGAGFPALDQFGLPKPVLRRAVAALAYGSWQIQDLVARWQQVVREEQRRVPNSYEGIRPVAADLTGFFRPQLQGCPSKHYVAVASKALPTTLVGAVGHLGSGRLALPRLMLSTTADAALETRLITVADLTLVAEEALIVDAGFELADLLAAEGRFVVRLAKNFTARLNCLPTYKGHGRYPEYGEDEVTTRRLAHYQHSCHGPPCVVDIHEHNDRQNGGTEAIFGQPRQRTAILCRVDRRS